MSNSDSGKWEKKTTEEVNKDKYRFNGERYGFRGSTNDRVDDRIPQVKGLYAFPDGDAQDIIEL